MPVSSNKDNALSARLRRKEAVDCGSQQLFLNCQLHVRGCRNAVLQLRQNGLDLPVSALFGLAALVAVERSIACDLSKIG